MLEDQAGLVVTGPNANHVEFTLNSVDHTLNYQKISLGGFDNEAQARSEGLSLATMRVFTVLGNPIRLMRTPVTIGMTTIEPVEGTPQGPILVWREGHEPTYEISEDGIYTVNMSFAVLPPFVILKNAV